MTIITTRISDDLDYTLTILAKEVDRPKGDIVRKAIHNYINEKADILIAMARIERGDDTISLSELEQKYDLAD